MEKEINTRTFVEHLILTFLIIGICWGLCILLGAFDITIKNCFWLYIPWFIGGISPAIASFIVLKKNHIVDGFIDWLKHVFDIKHKIWSYLLAIIFPVIQVLMMCLISGFKYGLPFYWLPLMILAMVFAGGLEEAGWRYITFPFLKKKCGFLLAALIVAFIWWIWHTPLFFIVGASQYHKDFLVFGIMVLGMSFMLAAIKEITGSVWLCILCHAIINSSGNFLHYDMYGSYIASSITTTVLIVLSIMAVLIYRHYHKEIRFENYQYSYYQLVCDFLIEINKENNYHNNWNWARFEWMHEHSLTNKEQLPFMGLWFDGNHLIGAALIDMFLGEAFVGVLPRYQHLYPEILKYAYHNLKDEKGLGVAIHDDNQYEIDEAIKQGFIKVEAEEVDCIIELDKEYPVDLPNGYRSETYDAQKNAKEIGWLFYQGFDHGNIKEEFLSQYKEPTGTREHFNPYLCIVIKNSQGELVASASTWYDSRVDYAYLEPVCVVPECRKMGIGKAAVYTAINHAKEVGAKIAIVNSNQEFYKHLGFVTRNHYSFYWKK